MREGGLRREAPAKGTIGSAARVWWTFGLRKRKGKEKDEMQKNPQPCVCCFDRPNFCC